MLRNIGFAHEFGLVCGQRRSARLCCESALDQSHRPVPRVAAPALPASMPFFDWWQAAKHKLTFANLLAELGMFLFQVLAVRNKIVIYQR